MDTRCRLLVSPVALRHLSIKGKVTADVLRQRTSGHFVEVVVMLVMSVALSHASVDKIAARLLVLVRLWLKPTDSGISDGSWTIRCGFAVECGQVGSCVDVSQDFARRPNGVHPPSTAQVIFIVRKLFPPARLHPRLGAPYCHASGSEPTGVAQPSSQASSTADHQALPRRTHSLQN